MTLITQKEAKSDGAARGKGAAMWKFDGNTADLTYSTFLRGYWDGDPMILDQYAPPDWLSGEWAGESMHEVLGEPETPRDAERQDDVANAYCEAADRAYWAELVRVARFHLKGTKLLQLSLNKS